MSARRTPGTQRQLKITAGAPRRKRDSNTPKAPIDLPEAAGTKLWVGNLPGPICELSEEEVKAAAKKMADDLFDGKKPAPADKRPHIILTIGGPGSGKSTVARICAEDMGVFPYENYVSVDFDTLVKYHPRMNDIWSLPDMLGRPTGIGYAFGWNCDAQFVPLVVALVEQALDQRYNIIVQSHWQPWLINAQLKDYFCTLLYVAAPLDVAKRRARARAVETGMFLAPTLAAQDEVVADMWSTYRKTVPWWALWADELALVYNGDDAKKPVKGEFLYLDPHQEGVPWKKKIEEIYDLIAGAHHETK